MPDNSSHKSLVDDRPNAMAVRVSVFRNPSTTLQNNIPHLEMVCAMANTRVGALRIGMRSFLSALETGCHTEDISPMKLHMGSCFSVQEPVDDSSEQYAAGGEGVHDGHPLRTCIFMHTKSSLFSRD
jgi:hypothetical protein